MQADMCEIRITHSTCTDDIHFPPVGGLQRWQGTQEEDTYRSIGELEERDGKGLSWGYIISAMMS